MKASLRVPARSPAITPEIMLRAYAAGIFPMAESVDYPSSVLGRAGAARRHPARWLSSCRPAGPPRPARTVSEVSVDRDFEAVIAACGEARPDRPETWINPRSAASSGSSSRSATSIRWSVGTKGFACRRALRAISLGAAFFGESMFHRETDASEGSARPSGRAAQARWLSEVARHAIPDRASRPVRHDRNPARSPAAARLDDAQRQ